MIKTESESYRNNSPNHHYKCPFNPQSRQNGVSHPDQYVTNLKTYPSYPSTTKITTKESFQCSPTVPLHLSHTTKRVLRLNSFFPTIFSFLFVLLPWCKRKILVAAERVQFCRLQRQKRWRGGCDVTITAR